MLDFTQLTLTDVPGVGTIQLDLMPNKKAYVFIGENGVGKTKLLNRMFEELAKASGSNRPKLAFINASNRGHIEKDKRGDELRQWIIAVAQAANPFSTNSSISVNKINTFLRILHEIDNRYDSKYLEIDSKSNIFLNVNNERKEIAGLSTGYVSLLKIIQKILWQYNDEDTSNTLGVVLIDEIESHLHLKWQANIIPKLKELFPNTTFIIATHSPIVISQLEDGEAYELVRDADDAVRTRKIDSPRNTVMIDLLNDAFGVDLNKIAIERPQTEQQKKAKQELMYKLQQRVAAQ